MLFCLGVVLLGMWSVVAWALPPLPEGQHWERVEPEVWASAWVYEGERLPGESASPVSALDYNKVSAWIFDNEDGGEGESIELWWSETRQFHGLLLQARNGCQATPWTFLQHRAVAEVRVELEVGGQSRSWERELSRTLGWQDVLVAQLPGITNAAPGLRLRVADLHAGFDPSGTCLADLALFVARSDDHEQRYPHKPQLLERTRTFVPSAGEDEDWVFPYASTRFTSTKAAVEPGSEAWENTVEELRALLGQAQALMEDAPCHRLHQKKESRGLLAPVGLPVDYGVSEYDAMVRLADWAIVDSDQELLNYSWSGYHFMHDSFSDSLSCHRGERAPDGAPPRALAQLATRHTAHGKGGDVIEYDDTLKLWIYNPGGQLVTEARFFISNDHAPALQTSGQLTRFSWHDGQIQSLEVLGRLPLDYEPTYPRVTRTVHTALQP